MTPAIPGINGFPLGAATKLHSADPALAERTVGGLIEPRRLSVCGKRRAIDIRISHVALGCGHLFGVKHGAAVHASTAGPIRAYQVMVPLRGSLTGHTRDGEIRATAGEALVYSPCDRLDTHWSEECTALVLSIPAERLRALALESAPLQAVPDAPLQPLMSLDQAGGRSFANALGSICQESLDPRSAFSLGVTARSLETTLLLSLLLSQSDAAACPALVASRKRQHYLARALALIERRCGDDTLAIEDLVSASGTSLRTLQYAFLERFGIGPMGYLKQTRLRRVHADLLAARPGRDTVGDIAARWGFYNGSAFACAYRKLFGQLPSQTLAAGY